MRLFAIEKDRFGDWSFALAPLGLAWLVFVVAAAARLGWALPDLLARFVGGHT